MKPSKNFWHLFRAVFISVILCLIWMFLTGEPWFNIIVFSALTVIFFFINQFVLDELTRRDDKET